MNQALALVSLALLISTASAGDNELSVREKEDGWLLLFNGSTLDGWMTSAGKPSKTPVEDGCLNPHKCGHYMLVRLDFPSAPLIVSVSLGWG
jgi:hypothetical protein